MWDGTYGRPARHLVKAAAVVGSGSGFRRRLDEHPLTYKAATFNGRVSNLCKPVLVPLPNIATGRILRFHRGRARDL